MHKGEKSLQQQAIAMSDNQGQGCSTSGKWLQCIQHIQLSGRYTFRKTYRHLAPHKPSVPERLNLLLTNCNIALHYLLRFCIIISENMDERFTQDLFKHLS